jgi:PAS domain-containing protein
MRPSTSNATAERVRLIEDLGLEQVVDSRPLNRIVRIAAHSTESPIALITVVGSARQSIVARVGWAETFTELVDAFCVRAVTGVSLLEIRNAAEDDRFRSNRLVTGPDSIRFYAGHPILHEGVPMGTVCVLDRRTRSLSQGQRDVLEDLAGTVSDFLQERADSQAIHKFRTQEGVLWRAADIVVIAADLDGRIVAASGSLAHILGYKPGSLVGKTVMDVLHVDWPMTQGCGVRCDAILPDDSRIPVVVEVNQAEEGYQRLLRIRVVST